MLEEGSKTSVKTILERTKITMCSWPGAQHQAFVSSYGMFLTPVIEGLAIPLTFMTLLQPWAYPAMPVITVAHRAHSCLTL